MKLSSIGERNELNICPTTQTIKNWIEVRFRELYPAGLAELEWPNNWYRWQVGVMPIAWLWLWNVKGLYTYFFVCNSLFAFQDAQL